ncbi:MAG: 2-oxo-hepta-3-ene-1,7-dioic acid hydratase [Alphaproteobacteria bacterium]
MKKSEIKAVAKALDQAERTHERIPMMAQSHPGMTFEESYEVQSAWTEIKLKAGREIRGRKIGLTSSAMQQAVGIDTPDCGVLFDDMFFEDGAVVPKDRFIEPRIEAEVAFIMGKPLKGPGVTIYDVLDATDYVVPSLEILDTRIMRNDPKGKHKRTIVDTIADNAGNAGIVTGGRPTRPNEIDLRWVGAIVSRNAKIEETGLGAGVLNHPANGIVWLCNHRLARFDDGLEAGQTVLSGSFIRPLDATHGSTIVADFGSFGTVSVYFE